MLAAAVGVTGAGVAAALPTQAAAAGCSVSYTVSSQWQDGFGAAVAAAA